MIIFGELWLDSRKELRVKRAHGSNHMYGYETHFLVSFVLGNSMEHIEQSNNLDWTIKVNRNEIIMGAYRRKQKEEPRIIETHVSNLMNGYETHFWCLLSHSQHKNN